MGLLEELMQKAREELKGVAVSGIEYLAGQQKQQFTTVKPVTNQPEPIAPPSTPLPSIPISPGSAAVMSPIVLAAIGIAAFFLFKKGK
jgi:hypothetical protein